MNEKPVNEKSAEILFNRFLLQAFPLGAIELFAPSSVEEFRRGYDTKIVGLTCFREIYLQFKAPTYSKARARFTIRPTRHQHSLLQAYDIDSAYYVASTFQSLKELNEAQTSLQAEADFLQHFVCIEISHLPAVVDFFHYE